MTATELEAQDNAGEARIQWIVRGGRDLSLLKEIMFCFFYSCSFLWVVVGVHVFICHLR